MTFKTHQAFNLAIISALTASNYFPLVPASQYGNYIFIGGMIVGGALPDIDSPNSKIRHTLRRIFGLGGSQSIHGDFNHRRFATHWPLFWLGVAAIPMLVTVSGYNKHIALFGFFIGVFGHLFLDMFNPKGIRLLAPFSKKGFHFANITTSSIGEYIFLAVILVFSGAMFYF